VCFHHFGAFLKSLKKQVEKAGSPVNLNQKKYFFNILHITSKLFTFAKKSVQMQW